MNKENQSNVFCSACIIKRDDDDEHVCSSQLLSDSISTLSEMANEQLHILERFSLDSVKVKCEKQLESWHTAAVQHLGQILSQHLEDLSKIYHDQLLLDLKVYREKILDQLEKRLQPKVRRMINEQDINTKQIQIIQNILSEMKCEYDLVNERQWIQIQLPDLKNFTVPIRIAKMALAARLTDGEKDPLETLSDDENDKKKKHFIDADSQQENNLPSKKKTSLQNRDLLEIFSSNGPSIKSYTLETNSSTLAFSNRHILIHDSKKLMLYDLTRKIYDIEWNDNDFGILVDLCWMSSISLFVILTIHSVYLFDPMKTASTSPPVKINSIRPLDRTHVLASVCVLDRDLYINYHKGVHIDQYRCLSASEWILQKRYSKTECCESKDIGIRDVRSNGEYLCLSIMQNDDLTWRLDLMSRDMVRVRRGVPMDSAENQHKFFSMLIPAYNNQWLFVNWFTNKLWFVDQQGKTRLVKESLIRNIRNISMSSDSSLMAIRTEKPSLLQIYKID